MKITAQISCLCWACPTGTDVNHFDSISDLKWYLENNAQIRFAEFESALIWYGTLIEVTDLYPDREITVGPRGGLKICKI